MSLSFTKRLRDPIRRGEITCSVRIWQSPRVNAGNSYSLDGGGQVQVTGLKEISLADITPALARKSGFAGVVDLLKIAKHGPGQRVFLIEFAFETDV